MDHLFYFAVFVVVGGLAFYILLLGYHEYRRVQMSFQVATLEREHLQKRIQLISSQQHFETNRSELSWNGFRKFVIASKKSECDEVCSFYLAPHDGKPLPPYQPGQYLTFQLNIPGLSRPVIRCYSLSDSPNHPDYYRVTIKKIDAPTGKPDIPPGLVSSFFHDQLGEGDIVDVKAPSGHFYLDMSSQTPTVLIAGGVGLTPLLSMLNTVVEAASQREIWLFYGVRDGKEVIHGDHLLRLAEANPNIRVHLCFSKPSPEDRKKKNHHAERVTVDLLKKMLPSNNFDFFICGPPAMMDIMIPALKAWGVPDKNIFLEAFGAATIKKAAPQSEAAVSGATFQVTFSRSKKACKWDSKVSSLLDLALDHDVRIDSGCRAGNCGTCLTAIKSGEVTYLNEPGAKIEQGSCLTCIAVPKSDLVLDA